MSEPEAEDSEKPIVLNQRVTDGKAEFRVEFKKRVAKYESEVTKKGPSFAVRDEKGDLLQKAFCYDDKAYLWDATAMSVPVPWDEIAEFYRRLREG